MVFTIGLGGCSLTNTPAHVIRCVDGLLKIPVATPSLVLPQSRLDRWWAGHNTALERQTERQIPCCLKLLAGFRYWALNEKFCKLTENSLESITAGGKRSFQWLFLLSHCVNPKAASDQMFHCSRGYRNISGSTHTGISLM